MDTYRQLIKSALAKRNWTTFHLFSFFEHYCSSVLPRFPVPKRCIHHLSHNNNNLFSHIGKKGVGGVKIANRPSVQWVCAYMPSKDKHTLMCPTAAVGAARGWGTGTHTPVGFLHHLVLYQSLFVPVEVSGCRAAVESRNRAPLLFQCTLVF